MGEANKKCALHHAHLIYGVIRRNIFVRFLECTAQQHKWSRKMCEMQSRNVCAISRRDISHFWFGWGCALYLFGQRWSVFQVQLNWLQMLCIGSFRPRNLCMFDFWMRAPISVRSKLTSKWEMIASESSEPKANVANDCVDAKIWWINVINEVAQDNRIIIFTHLSFAYEAGSHYSHYTFGGTFSASFFIATRRRTDTRLIRPCTLVVPSN